MKDKKIIITIDGYSSCGKSTLALQLAQSLNYIFIDSGAMYRAITLYFLQHNMDSHKSEDITRALNQIHLSFLKNPDSKKSDILLNGENVEKLIREMKVSEQVSQVASIAEVRAFAVSQQKEMGLQKGVVMEGRDIGTTVFPNAELKIFLLADMHTRILRRYDELKKITPGISIDEVRKNIEHRDYLDSHREISPLRKADDAKILDNTHLTLEEELDIVLAWANKIIRDE
ncbi:MAG: (d)CMP kinase [Bacteroidetes bacterium]|nr:(d)CMP kinase [Bacteroidota bacterium]